MIHVTDRLRRHTRGPVPVFLMVTDLDSLVSPGKVLTLKLVATDRLGAPMAWLRLPLTVVTSI